MVQTVCCPNVGAWGLGPSSVEVKVPQKSIQAMLFCDQEGLFLQNFRLSLLYLLFPLPCYLQFCTSVKLGVQPYMLPVKIIFRLIFIFFCLLALIIQGLGPGDQQKMKIYQARVYVKKS